MAGLVRGVTAAALRGQRRCFSSKQRVVDPTRWVKGSGSNKLAGSPDEAIADIFPGATLCVGGFGLCGSALHLQTAVGLTGQPCTASLGRIGRTFEKPIVRPVCARNAREHGRGQS